MAKCLATGPAGSNHDRLLQQGHERLYAPGEGQKRDRERFDSPGAPEPLGVPLRPCATGVAGTHVFSGTYLTRSSA